MRFGLLGPFEARDKGGLPLTIGSRRQERCLLAILLLEPGHVVTTQRLMDLLWDDQPPESARGAVHTYVGRLRRSLAPHGVRIATRHDGYLIDTTGHQIDAEEFVSLTHQAGQATDPADRVRLYDEALALWRGPLLADVADAPLRMRLDATLTELRLSSMERRAEAQLAMGRQDRVVADLLLVAEHYPTRERLVALLMTALYRSSRQAEALRAYERTVKVLDADLGVEPGLELRELYRQILRGDPRLRRPAAPMYAVRVRDQWLPWSTAGHPALEFCNTYSGWGNPPVPGADWLRSYATLAVWAGYTELVDDGTVSRLVRIGRRSPAQAAAVLEEAKLLRRHLYACLTNPDGTSFAIVARFAEAAAKASVFALDAGGLGRWTLSAAEGLRLAVHAAAQSAAELLSDPRRRSVVACPNGACGWLFLDASGRRKWCSVFTCSQRRDRKDPLC
jgi:SARP family transcriptional regulator, regulator of embCAB operon